MIVHPPDIYFFPRAGLLDAGFLFLRKHPGLKGAVVTYVVYTLDHGEAEDRSSLAARTLSASILEADAVVGNSRYVTETIHQSYGIPARTIHSGIDRRYFYPPSPGRIGQEDPHSTFTVLYAGSFQARKRVDFVIREAVRWPEVCFRLVGSGEEMEKCKDLSHHLGCQNVTFLGHLAPALLGEEMRKADVFLFPSLEEGHPQVLGQATACGLPCLAMNTYHPDYVVNEKTGFLVSTDGELSEKLNLLLTHPDLRQSMSRTAVEHSQQFKWEQIIGQWEGVFEEVTSRRLEG